MSGIEVIVFTPPTSKLASWRLYSKTIMWNKSEVIKIFSNMFHSNKFFKKIPTFLSLIGVVVPNELLIITRKVLSTTNDKFMKNMNL
jgi:hypothetical protein